MDDYDKAHQKTKRLLKENTDSNGKVTYSEELVTAMEEEKTYAKKLLKSEKENN